MNQTNKFSSENFEELFKKSVSGITTFQEHIVKGIVIATDQYYYTVDVGLKSEGKILISEFKNQDGTNPSIAIGDEVEVYIEEYETDDGSILLSREKAKREEIWHELSKLCKEGVPVQGFVSKRVKGGFAVTVMDTLAFLPGSQLDVRPLKNINALVGTTQTLLILKMDKKRFNIVVSRKAIISQNIFGVNGEQQDQYKEGQTVSGAVKNITGYGAFIDLGNLDGLLHVTDISWGRINHPSEILELGQILDLKIIKINQENKRISLGLKQLSEDPWFRVIVNYKVGESYSVKIANITDYGIFVELDKGVEGLVHISEMSWVKKDINLRADFKVGDTVVVKVMEIDDKKRRVNLSIKQGTDNPWIDFFSKNPEDTVLDVEIKDINDNGLVVKLSPVLDGFIRLSDISWENKGKELLEDYKIGGTVKAKIIKNDAEKEKVLLSVKHLSADPTQIIFEHLKKGTIVTGKITAVSDVELEVEVATKIENPSTVIGTIRKNDLALDKDDQKLESFSVGDSVEALIVQINTFNKTLSLSIKALEIAEQKKQMTNESEVVEESATGLAQAFAEAMSKKDQSK